MQDMRKFLVEMMDLKERAPTYRYSPAAGGRWGDLQCRYPGGGGERPHVPFPFQYFEPGTLGKFAVQ